MALDPSIILGIKPVEQDDPYKRAATISALQDQKQIQSERALQLMGLQRQQETASALDQALSKATVIDPQTGKINTDRAAAVANLKQGGFGSAALGLQEGWQKADQEQVKANLANQGVMLKNQQMHVEAIGQVANAVLSAPLEQQPALYAQVRQHMVQQGIVSPDELPEQYNPQVVQAAQAQSMKASEVLAAQAKKVDQDQKSLDLSQQASRNAADANFKQGELANTRRGQDITMRGQNMTDSRERQRIVIENQRLNFQKNQGGLGADGQPLEVIDAIGSGRINAGNLSRILTKNPGLISAVAQKYPDFDTSKVEAYTALVKTVEGGGKQGQQLNSGATVAKHLQELAALNTAASHIPGTAAHQAYQNKVDTLAPELAGFYGHTTDTSIKDLKSTLNATFNRDAAIKTQAGSMLDKLDTFEEQWKDAAPSKVYESQLPGTIRNAQESLRGFVGKQGSAPSGKITVTAPDGSQHPFDSQAQADHFKKLAGIK